MFLVINELAIGYYAGLHAVLITPNHCLIDRLRWWLSEHPPSGFGCRTAILGKFYLTYSLLRSQN